MLRRFPARVAAGPLILVSLLLAGGCSLFEGGNTNGGAVAPPPPSGAGDGKVVVQGIAYNPERIEVPVGQELVWTISDNGLTHTVTADDGTFDSGRLASGEFRHAFTSPGAVAYHCEVHARMKGTVVVG